MDVIEYVAEKVRRQRHDIETLDGIERIGWMLSAWSYALRRTQKVLRPDISIIPLQ